MRGATVITWTGTLKSTPKVSFHGALSSYTEREVEMPEYQPFLRIPGNPSDMVRGYLECAEWVGLMPLEDGREAREELACGVPQLDRRGRQASYGGL